MKSSWHIDYLTFPSISIIVLFFYAVYKYFWNFYFKVLVFVFLYLGWDVKLFLVIVVFIIIVVQQKRQKAIFFLSITIYWRLFDGIIEHKYSTYDSKYL